MDDLQAQIQQRQCGHKLMYPDLEHAREAAKSMHKRNKARFAAYRCQFCDLWHVGTVRSAQAGQRRRERRSA